MSVNQNAQTMRFIWGLRFMKSIPINAPSALGILMPRNAVRYAQSIAFHLIPIIPKRKSNYSKNTNFWVISNRQIKSFNLGRAESAWHLAYFPQEGGAEYQLPSWWLHPTYLALLNLVFSVRSRQHPFLLDFRVDRAGDQSQNEAAKIEGLINAVGYL